MSNIQSNFSLYSQAEIMRQELYDMAKKNGLNDLRVLKKSQELDKVIVELQKRGFQHGRSECAEG